MEILFVLVIAVCPGSTTVLRIEQAFTSCLNILKFIKKIFYWNIVALQCCLVSAVHQSASAICIDER